MAFLKSIRISGFKTFARPTDLVLEPGVTVIIGPNGSGKSNIADAVLWALGEQSPGALRAKSMQDVIHTGPQGRRRSSAAEVRLLFDNTEGDFPEPFVEIEIVRRMTREGGSDYLINGVPRRLLDVQELISTVGLGREMHSVISQGKVEEFLNATPRARRALLEEAAGLGIYKKRRDRTLSKLERVNANLNRVRDIEREVKGALRPLKAQVHAAERHAEIAEEIAADEARMALFELLSLEERLGGLRLSISQAEAGKNDFEGELAALHETRLQEEDIFAATVREREKTMARYHEARAGIERVETQGTLTARRRARAEQEAARAGRAVEAAAAEAEAAHAYLEAVRCLPGASTWRRAIVATATAEVARALRDAEDMAATAEAEEERLRDEFLDLETKRSRERQQVEFLERERIEAEARSAAFVARLAEERGRREAQAEENARLTDEVASLEGELERASAAEQAATYASREAEEASSNVAGVVRGLQGALEAAETRLIVLQGVLDKRSGFSAGVERVLGRETQAQPLIELLEVQKGWERAVIAALGPLAGAASVPAEAGRKLLMDTQGPVDLVLAPSGVTGEADAEMPAVHSSPDQDRREVDLWSLVDGPPRLIAVLRRLVPATTVVPDIVGLGPVPGGKRVVSMLGEILVGNEYVGRQQEAAAETLLHARADHRDLTADCIRLRKELEQAESRLQEARSLAQEMLTERAAQEAEVATLGRRTAEAREELEVAARRVEQAGEEMRELVETGSRHEAQAVEIARQQAGIKESLDACEVLLDSLRARVRESRNQVERLRRTRGFLERKRTQASVLTVRLRERERVFGAELARAEKRSCDAGRAQREARGRCDAWMRLEAPLRQLEEVTSGLAEVFKRRLDGLKSDLAASAAESATFAATLKEHGRREGELQRALGVLGEELMGLQVARAHVEDEAAEKRGVLGELRRRHLSPRAIRAEDVADLDIGRSRDRVDSLNRRLERIGPVNPLADREYRETEERAGFLAEQRSDLENSVSELESVVRDLDEHIETVFADMFAKTQTNFAEMTETLFPEGSGILCLEPVDAPVDAGIVGNGDEPEAHGGVRTVSGIRMEIRLPKKGAKTLTLLSGGEKALAAIAFLFALFLARPCPFYVLDEVEAALDDVNISRFLSLIRRYQHRTQFLIITHQRRTMEIADILYGVTMEGEGVSRLLSRRLSNGGVAREGSSVAATSPSLIHES